MNRTTLWQLTDELHSLLEIAADPESDTESFEAAIHEIQGSIREKIIAMAALASNLDALAQSISAAMVRMDRRMQRAELSAMQLRDRIKQGMETLGTRKIETPEFRVTVKKNPHTVVILSPQSVPADYLISKEVKEPDRKKIKDALQSGKELLFAMLVQQERVEIK